MSQLSNSLEKRIQELTQSIESQKAQLAAYERVLHLERGNGHVSTEEIPPEIEVDSDDTSDAHEEEVRMTEVAALPATGNKTSMVADVIRTYGSMGATPKEVNAFLTARNIKRSKNLVYNTLSYLVAQKKLERRDGRYFTLETESSPRKKAATRTKRRLSPEGLKRIREALKKRWAAKRAAEGTAKRVVSKRGRKKKIVSK